MWRLTVQDIHQNARRGFFLSFGARDERSAVRLCLATGGSGGFVDDHELCREIVGGLCRWQGATSIGIRSSSTANTWTPPSVDIALQDTSRQTLKRNSAQSTTAEDPEPEAESSEVRHKEIKITVTTLQHV